MVARRTPRGFTLIELVVALTVSGLVLLTARAIVVGALEAEASVTGAAHDADASANAERVLQALVGQVDLSDPEGRFAGTDSETRFPSWCSAPAGWLERCDVALHVERGTDGDSLVARVGDGTALTILRGRRIQVRYLASASGGGSWLAHWGTGVTLPLALGFIVDSDTLIVRTGDRT